MNGFVLHNYFRSGTSYRVRIAMHLKGLDYEYVPIHLRKGEQRDAGYLALNPQGLVPTLVMPDGSKLTQSLAILEYLDDMYPEPRILPENAWERARVRQLAHVIALDIHPINNLRVLKQLRKRFAADDAVIADWFCHWVATGFTALEEMLATSEDTSRFCHGDTPTLADICLVPQALGSKRFGFELDPYPTIKRIVDECMRLPAFSEAAPDAQPDAEQ